MSSRFLTDIYSTIQSMYLQGKNSLETYKWTDNITKWQLILSGSTWFRSSTKNQMTWILFSSTNYIFTWLHNSTNFFVSDVWNKEIGSDHCFQTQSSIIIT